MCIWCSTRGKTCQNIGSLTKKRNVEVSKWKIFQFWERDKLRRTMYILQKTYLISNHLMALLVCDILRQVFAQWKSFIVIGITANSQSLWIFDCHCCSFIAASSVFEPFFFLIFSSIKSSQKWILQTCVRYLHLNASLNAVADAWAKGVGSW